MFADEDPLKYDLEDLPKLLTVSRAAVDINTGYDADAFTRAVANHELYDELSQCSFVSLVDTVINYQHFFIPLPDPANIYELDSPSSPKTLQYLQEFGYVEAITDLTAADYVSMLSDEALKLQYVSFREWIIDNRRLLRSWLARHYPMAAEKANRPLRGKVSPTVEYFWNNEISDKEVSIVADLVGVRYPEQLLYAFDNMVRGLQYLQITAEKEIIYSPHPLRRPLTGTRKLKFPSTRQRWSWGRLLALLMKQERIPCEWEPLMQLVVELRGEVKKQDATWNDLYNEDLKEQRDRVECVAAYCNIPPDVKTEIADKIGATWHLATATSALISPWLTVVGEVIKFAASFWKPNVSFLYEIPSARNLINWPGLFNEDAEGQELNDFD